MFPDVLGLQLELFNASVKDQIWHEYDSHGDFWHRKFITIQPQTSPFQVINNKIVKQVANNTNNNLITLITI